MLNRMLRQILIVAVSSLLIPWLVLIGAGVLPVSAQAQQPDIGDYIYCSPTYWFPNFSFAGHGAIYVGSYGAPYGDVVERRPSGIQFTTLSYLQGWYHNVRVTNVVAMPQSMRIAAAERAVEVAIAIQGGQHIPWYSEPFKLGPRDCISTFQQFYLDIGATEDQVGSPDDYVLPAGAWRFYKSGRDWDQSITGNGGVLTGGSQGGVESRPLWLNESHKSTLPLKRSSELLEQLMPSEALEGETGYPMIPDIIGISNAVSAAGMDYIDEETDQVIASILGAETIDAAYEHDYAVCARVRKLEVNDMLSVPADSTWWHVVNTIESSTDSSEVEISLIVQLNGALATLDSQYPVERYGSVSGTILNYQIRSANLIDAMFLVDRITQAADSLYSLSCANVSEPPEAMVFIRYARYEKPNIELTVDNRGEEHSVRFYGTVWTEPRSGADQWVDFDLDVPSGTSLVNLPVGGMYDAVIFAEDGLSLDKAYVPSGFWFSFNDNASGGTSQVSMSLNELVHEPFSIADTNFISPPLVEMTGIVTEDIPWSYIGVGYSPNQERDPIDVSSNCGIAFYAKGDEGQYRVKLETEAVTDNDYHGAFFTAPTDWELIFIPFSELQQEGWGLPVPWTGTDLHTISFVTTERPLPTVLLDFDRISFLSHNINAVDPFLFDSEKVTVWTTPNPFHGTMDFLLATSNRTAVMLDVFDIQGRRVRSLVENHVYESGLHRISWNGKGDNGQVVAGGVYFYRLKTMGREESNRIVLIR
ncbi:MAG: CIA30 family protein [Candidatus Eisenbacteria bacterium]|uniref:CIA30 family protein n=1 Tax=Eiseniibacteriota bacterium TaxID=2212470 RepID=A0A948RST3_UNCEI|nr:CIA30 family protein [Candidatus Eisenbacteria bacterium]MBU1948455.1 CIA30 family protein [Candidatus Eisenbacteria bacterium]MBU2689931.1 CIA30 family protein [Candidatus Eisenbacteria bacterium]